MTRKAARHARHLQLVIAAITFILAAIPPLIYPPIQACFDDWSLPADTFPILFMTPILLAMAIYASWSAVWTSLGSGRWMIRLLASFGIFHIAAVFGVAAAMGVEMIRQGHGEWRDLLAVAAAVSYAFAGQIVVLMSCLWPLKWLRFRLLYFDAPQKYPHPRRAGCGAPLDERPATSLLSARVYLADMFVLTTLIAVYLAAWYPLFEVALDDNRMFGATFLFVIVIIVFGTGAAVGVPIVLMPLIFAMLDHRGKRFQLTCQSILLGIVAVGAVVIAAIQRFDDQVVMLCAMGMIAFLANQLLLVLVLRRPSRWFRFRLVRLKG